MDFESGQLIGDFRIEKRLGAGGMGVVYRAKQESLNRLVALKILGGPIQTDSAIVRFKREAKAIAKLDHPNIANVLFVGQDVDVCYMVMTLIDGVTLREVMRRAQRISVPATSLDDTYEQGTMTALPSPVMRFDVETEIINPNHVLVENNLTAEAKRLIRKTSYIRRCVECIVDVGKALAYAHANGVIHRDIKPENLLLDRSGKVTVIDFGLARYYDDETITYTGQLVGTPLYMSPEQVLGGKSITPQTDVYSLGMVLYELLTLEPPIQANNRESLFREIMTRSLTPVSWRNPSVTEPLQAVVHQALARDTLERYSSMEAFVEDLSRYLSGNTVKASAYRYRFDEAEIRAKRPGAVVYLAFLCFFVAIMTGVPSSLANIAIYSPNVTRILILCATIAQTIFLFLLGHSLLKGRFWAKIAGQVFGFFYLGIFIASFIALPWSFQILWGGRGTEYLLFGIICGICGLAFLAILFHPKVGAWFEFAREAKRQFQGKKRIVEASLPQT